MHSILRLPPQDNPTSTMLTPQASFLLQKGALLALGTLDDQSRPWTTLWGGSPGFSEPLGEGFIGTRTLVDSTNDPVVQALVGSAKDGEMLQPKDGGKMLAGLAIDLMTRKRVKIAGKMIAGTVRDVSVNFEQNDKPPVKQREIQLVSNIDQSLGNCPKYLNQYAITPAIVDATLVSDTPELTADAKRLIHNADMFFLTTSTPLDMDTNHRGGPPGFVRIPSSTTLIYPEYSGNRLYQSLGNLVLNPRIGLAFPDFSTGNVLYVTGTATILIGADAAAVIPASDIAVRIDVAATRYVEKGLPFRGEKREPSPYNPRVRPLATEGNIKALHMPISCSATLVKKVQLTPSIARFTFGVPGGMAYAAGQWVALSFKEELDIGYEHMRNEDPRSLNDDFVRTFSISSTPSSSSSEEEEFDITVRNVGAVTSFLSKQNPRSGFSVPVLGVGGAFRIEQTEGTVTPFIAGGVGITALLGQVNSLDLAPGRFKLFWTVRREDVGLLVDTLRRTPGLVGVTEVFVTGGTGNEGELEEVRALGVDVKMRRLAKEDLDAVEAQAWYVCAGKGFRGQVLGWLEGKRVEFEDFDY
jgi:ferredoxin-NADP reductase